MQILILSWEYTPHITGGLGRHVSELTMAMGCVAADLGVSIDVVTPGYAGGAPIEEVADSLSIHRIDLPWISGDFYTGIAGNNQLMAQYASRHYKERPPDLIHIHDWFTGIAGLALKQRWNIPLLVTIHGIQQNKQVTVGSLRSKQQIDELEKNVGREAEHVVVCSAFMRQEAHEQLAIPLEKITVIPNGVAIEPRESGSRDELEVLRRRFAPAGQKLLLYVGRITYLKGVLVLIRSMPAILSMHANARLLVVGDRGSSLKPLAHELGVDHAIDFLGHVSDSECHNLYRIADAVIVPSLYEPSGIGALEAMALGATVIASNVGGLPEFIEHMQTGLLVNAGDSDSIAQAVDLLFADPAAAQKWRKQAFDKVNQTYRWEKVAAQTIQLYQSIAAPPKHAFSPNKPLVPLPANLTQRELDVISMRVRGFSNAQMAERLGISVYTVNAHLRNIYKKIGTSVRSDLVEFARVHRLL